MHVAFSELLRQYVHGNIQIILLFCIKHNHASNFLAIFFISHVKGAYTQANLQWGKFNNNMQNLFDINPKNKNCIYFYENVIYSVMKCEEDLY